MSITRTAIPRAASNRPNTADRLLRAREFALAAARLAADTRCSRVVAFELNGLSPLADYFVIATGTSGRQMRSVCDDILKLATDMGHVSRHSSGFDGESWMICDFVDVVVHVFSPEARQFYDLDSLWADAKSLELPAPAAKPTA